MIQAEELTVPAVLDAIRGGRLYATQGPRFRSIELADGELRVSCSPVDSIVFYSNTPWVAGRARCAQGQTEAVYQPAKNDRFLRVQIIDSEGRSAWSCPIDLR